ncbi:hypothetical protein G9C98_007045 [Cotesia typhae]|uniref:EGF-like domain-containing protein n=1 Tax=Cotesia typhae TaxID=2053667 RepID=A0A8J5QZA2_9HYME|nr:hypothetical protein G9C98_007045 [Cotesia typhae]
MDQMIALSTQNPLSLLMKFGMMAWNSTCNDNCSGHGECHNGTCLCEIQFDGSDCHVPNSSYYIAFATMFFILAFVCLTQLVMCIVAEWQKMKAPSFLRACRVTTQKVLYFIVFLATAVRGAYFTCPTAFAEGWSRTLSSTYYPLLLSGSSLIVCFWAEVFHVPDIRTEKPLFLSKSFLAFVVFNIINYSLLLAELITSQMKSEVDQSFYTNVFNGCYAIRGGFIVKYQEISIATNVRTPGEDKSNEEPTTAKLFEPTPSTSAEPINVSHHVNTSQLNQSRFGILSQAFMLFIVIVFLFSETLSEFWKTKVPLVSRNYHNVVFHVIEVGVALWFPCVLWNCMSPERLWILNPKRILKHLDLDQSKYPTDGNLQEKRCSVDAKLLIDNASVSSKDCWICYDSETQDAGPLIQPFCGSKYNVEHATKLDWQNSMTPRHWITTIATVTAMCGSFAAAWILIQFVESPIIRMLAAGAALLVMYVCIRFLSLNTVVAYQRAKISALNIVSSDNGNIKGEPVNTVSNTVALNLPKIDPTTV